MPHIILQTQQLTIGYPTRKAARRIAEDISVSLSAGELVCLIGPNGAGKSTLMRTLAGMQKPLNGRVLLMGDDAHLLAARDIAKRLSIVLTERVEAGLMTGYALVALGRHPYTDWMGRLSAHDEAVVRWAVQAVGGEKLAERPVNELSDGERQKIMIARALAQEPVLMILDEPTAFLDLPRRVEIMQLLRQLAHTTHRAVLLSTHDLDLALRTADRIWLLPSSGPLQAGAPEDLVLNGAFEQAFHSAGVSFDMNSGSFRLTAQHQAEITVNGNGVAALWTRRALEREGFAIVADASVRVDVVENGGGTRWRLDDLQHVTEHPSLYALTVALRNKA